ncbi:MAG: 6-phosphofructokinase [Clostridium sp.]|uniref:6-phosphofructokinase n=1 Tax=Clostridium neonatale TaxID=137838 RepID=UPI001DBF4D7D|nr:6-phosphofructokinase [Clostridium neonatale]MBS5950278.1 6-phosphofructokinase [Clostridium sp.]CAI3636217.1 Pyrophosphate--fructose 6-phosphate 1-phosphotransferase [Clostridium neonatale]CAI3705120.1 Pyrophosphate--fructose 6-phosphate 1-phosphotransferase [Clostridium neonatale]
MKNLLVAQSGGPTAAINSTLAGIIAYAYTKKDMIGTIYGAINGIEGVFKENFMDIEEKVKNTESMNILCNTPSSALGSCRYKLGNRKEDEEKLKNIIDIFRKYNIGYFIYIGGNDSMDTVNRISQYCKLNKIDDIKVVGAPKTIDNDLAKIDHCPGFGSAAKYIATTFAEIERDVNVYDNKSVTIVEVMGRDVGWLTSAAALSKFAGGNGPNLIYLCETEFSIEGFIQDVKKELKSKSKVIVAISEGLKDKNGRYISEEVQSDMKDSFGHKYISGAATVLANFVRKEIGCKVRSIELNLMQRCSAHILSRTDIDESKLLGMKACQCAVDGNTGVMSTIIRKSNTPYEIRLDSVPVSEVANVEKSVPLNWINKECNGVQNEMIEYLLPLIQGEVQIEYRDGVPKHMILQ